jgi:hypothetical protein
VRITPGHDYSHISLLVSWLAHHADGRTWAVRLCGRPPDGINGLIGLPARSCKDNADSLALLETVDVERLRQQVGWSTLAHVRMRPCVHTCIVRVLQHRALASPKPACVGCAVHCLACRPRDPKRGARCHQ